MTYDDVIKQHQEKCEAVLEIFAGGARKDDDGKLRFDLIPLIGLEELAKVYTEGAKKYNDDNWRNGIVQTRIIAAMFRHIQAWRKGEVRHDAEMHHLASVAWGCMALMEYEVTNPKCVER